MVYLLRKWHVYILPVLVLNHNLFISNDEPALHPLICSDHLKWFIQNLKFITVSLFHKNYTTRELWKYTRGIQVVLPDMYM